VSSDSVKSPSYVMLVRCPIWQIDWQREAADTGSNGRELGEFVAQHESQSALFLAQMMHARCPQHTHALLHTYCAHAHRNRQQRAAETKLRHKTSTVARLKQRFAALHAHRHSAVSGGTPMGSRKNAVRT
jgi:hypothetical protein